MSVVKDAEGTITITLTRAEVEALYVDAVKVVAFTGSDEWDLNDAFHDGALAALDAVRGLRPLLVSREATCSECGDTIEVPGDEPADTLCVACAEEAQGN